MNTFKWNLQRFQKAMGFSRTDIQELSELSDDELSILEEDVDTTFNPKLLHKFCLQTGIDLTTIYSDKGFEVVDAISQFRACPDDLKFMITCQLFKKLKELAGSEAMLKSILTKELPDMKKSISRYCNGTSRLEADQLTKVAAVLDKANLIKAAELMDIVLELKYKWIPNYNYRALKAHYNLSYSEVAERLGVKVSLVNNWGGLNCIHFPAKFLYRVSVMFGYYDVAEFATTIISTKVADMEGRTCMNVEEMAPYREEVKLTKAGKQVSKKAKKAKKSPVDYVPPELVMKQRLLYSHVKQEQAQQFLQNCSLVMFML